MANRFEYDLLVIGGGSGGVRAARIAAGHGARVAIVEEYRYGGTCVIRGCVPKKLYTYAAEFSSQFVAAGGFGWQVSGAAFRWDQLVRNKDREIARLETIYRKLLADAGVVVLDGRARLVDAHAVDVGGRAVTAETLLIATGGKPSSLPVPGGHLAISSNEAFDLPELPAHVLVVGGGYIACEFASIFRGLGASVTQLLRGSQMLRGFDDDVRHHLAEEMRRHGIVIRTGAEVASLVQTTDGIRSELSDGSQLDADCVLAAIGRRPNTEGLGLEAVGVRLSERGAVEVDAWARTSVANIFAVGDVTDRVALTPVALAEGHAFADSMYGGRPRTVDLSNVPSAVFSHPNVAVVGMTEAEARAHYPQLDIYRSVFKPLKHTLSGLGDRTMMKLVVDGASQRVVGCHMVGPDAGEIIQGLAIAVKMGAKKSDFDATIGVHPTSAEEFVTMRQKVAARAAT